MEYYYKMESPLFTEDGWLDTGDMGYQNEDAFVFFVDRKKDMVNRGGEKIWCTDVEDELIAFKGLKMQRLSEFLMRSTERLQQPL